MEGRRPEFFIDVAGKCYFCLKGISSSALSLNEAETESKLRMASFQHLSRYLRIDRRQRVVEALKTRSDRRIAASILRGVGEGVEKSNLIIELCDTCAEMNDKFCALYEQWLNIEMAMGHCLDGIQKKMKEADVEGRFQKVKQIFKGWTKSNMIPKSSTKINQSFWRETLQKCQSKKEQCYPKVNIAGLTKRTIRKKTRRGRIPRHLPPVLSDDTEPINETKHVPPPNSTQELRIPFYGAMPMRSRRKRGSSAFEESKPVIKTEESSAKPTSNSTAGALLRRSILRPRNRKPSGTGALQVNNRSKIKHRVAAVKTEEGEKDPTLNSGRGDYLDAALMRFRCALCNKFFWHKWRLTSHMLKIHGPGYKCVNCPKSFRELSLLKAHISGNSCSRKLEKKAVEEDAVVDDGESNDSLEKLKIFDACLDAQKSLLQSSSLLNAIPILPPFNKNTGATASIMAKPKPILPFANNPLEMEETELNITTFFPPTTSKKKLPPPFLLRRASLKKLRQRKNAAILEERLRARPDKKKSMTKSSLKAKSVGAGVGATPPLRTEPSTSDTAADLNQRTCSYCLKTFLSYKRLKIHVSASHANKPHKCLSCDASYIRIGHLYNHMKICKGNQKPKPGVRRRRGRLAATSSSFIPKSSTQQSATVSARVGKENKFRTSPSKSKGAAVISVIEEMES